MTKTESTPPKPRSAILAFLALWLVSLALYASVVARWSLSGDEFYTYEDSTYSIAKMLSFNSRPLYFIVCHFLLKWNPGIPVEVLIRLPAVLASSLIAPCFFALLRPRRYQRLGILAAILAMLNPWVFQMSQFGRYYAFVIFFAMLTTLAAYRFVSERQPKWLMLMVVSVLLATASHPPAVLLLPACILGLIVVQFWENPEVGMRLMKTYGPLLCCALLLAALAGAYLLQDVIREWSSAGKSDFGGGYDLKNILMSLAVVGGISSWAVALLPLLRHPKTWSSHDVFLLVLLVSSTLPLLLLVPIGGGVSSRYLLYCLPCMFLLAARHWGKIESQLSVFSYRIALGIVILGCNVPQLLSIVADGDHFDHRSMASIIEELDLHNPIIYASDHRLADFYLDDRFQVMGEDRDELGLFAEGLPKALIQRGIELARTQERPLLLVSRQDRGLLSLAEQDWLYSRFAVLRTVERARFDHRRHRLILYHYRPVGESSYGTAQ